MNNLSTNDSNPEKLLLQNFHHILNHLQTQLNTCNSKMLYSLGFTEVIGNNYFLEDKDQLNQELLMLTNHITMLSQTIQQISQNIQHKLIHICDHKWIDDTIDINENKSQTIIYCEYCEISKTQ